MADEASDVVKYYRVRKNWADAKSQQGAYTILANAKAIADKHPGYEVYDWNGIIKSLKISDCSSISCSDCFSNGFPISFAEFVKQVKNPYCFRVGDMVVKDVYSSDGISLKNEIFYG